MRSSSTSSNFTDIINIEARTQRLDVDNREIGATSSLSKRELFDFDLRADRKRNQTSVNGEASPVADIFRAEKNIIDLYVLLLRFSSLVSETIPCHRDYRAFPQSKKDYLRKKFLIALGELEKLKPAVRQRINELNGKHTHQVNGWSYNHQNDLLDKPPFNKKTLIGNVVTKVVRPVAGESVYQGSTTQQYSYVRPVQQQFSRVPNEETLSRHSIFGPNGLNGQWQPPRTNEGVKYPSIIDLTPVEIPRRNVLSMINLVASVFEIFLVLDSFIGQSLCRNRLVESVKDELSVKSELSSSEPERSSLEPILTMHDDNQMHRDEEPCSLISFEATETPKPPTVIRQPSPPPVLAEVQDLIPATPPQLSVPAEVQDLVPATPPQLSEAEHKVDISSPDGLVCPESPLQLHISTTLMENFMKMAKSNTDKNLETCGVLAGSLVSPDSLKVIGFDISMYNSDGPIISALQKNRKFYVTALIIPKQESTSDSDVSLHLVSIYSTELICSLAGISYSFSCLPFYVPQNLALCIADLNMKGYYLHHILTHPTQSCFMSSIDVHTHYSYQIMLPEAVAIVMAPRDSSRTHGIFRLTTPGGMSVIRQCQKRGFHPHDPPTDGGPIYKACTDVYMNPNLKLDIIDLR
ncbi:unnamed protein product [Dovyalis caffra]|uniref:MPN domain-containing protein n=1 Tax=Dovyalis caffra TaxID=77055 RepID=A0AAV1SE84_9ROSI|nr:unnamed protein product [Dovyalis caffra]